MSTSPLAFNGIDARTGDYLLKLSEADLSRLAQGESLAPDLTQDLAARKWRDENKHYGPKEGIDPKCFHQTGWGVVFPDNVDPAIENALRELLDLRRSQAGQYYKEYTRHPTESKREWLKRNGAIAAMPADPQYVPYYILIVGSPEEIPYRFQYELDIEYAVGRLHFVRNDGTPDLEAYARYARGVVAAETGRVRLPRRAAFFGVHNPDDVATERSANRLVGPLRELLSAEYPRWTFPRIDPDRTHKCDLQRLLGGADTPALLFTASHGMGFLKNDPLQVTDQGALLCREWDGPVRWRRPIPREFYFAADDVSDDARLSGLIAFHFACFGAGTPRLDDFAHLSKLNVQLAIAAQPFVARLPQRLLGHPAGGALAVVGHVEHAWSDSFFDDALGGRLPVYESALKRLLDGHPVGSALEYFNQYYAALSGELVGALQNIKDGLTPSDPELADLWTAHNDARNFVVLGDPAVRLAANADPQSPE